MSKNKGNYRQKDDLDAHKGLPFLDNQYLEGTAKSPISPIDVGSQQRRKYQDTLESKRKRDEALLQEMLGVSLEGSQVDPLAKYRDEMEQNDKYRQDGVNMKTAPPLQHSSSQPFDIRNQNKSPIMNFNDNDDNVLKTSRHQQSGLNKFLPLFEPGHNKPNPENLAMQTDNERKRLDDRSAGPRHNFNPLESSPEQDYDQNVAQVLSPGRRSKKQRVTKPKAGADPTDFKVLLDKFQASQEQINQVDRMYQPSEDLVSQSGNKNKYTALFPDKPKNVDPEVEDISRRLDQQIGANKINKKYGQDLNSLHDQFKGIIDNIDYEKQKFKQMERNNREALEQQQYVQLSSAQKSHQEIQVVNQTAPIGPSGMQDQGKSDFQMYSLNIDNKRLRQETADQKMQIFELQQDLQYLQQSIENHLPVISDLEVRNRELENLASSQGKGIKQLALVQQKLRILEEKYQSLETRHQQEKTKMTAETKSLKERLETVKNMNLNLQKINGKSKKKAEQFDFVTKKCEELHKANQRLIQILANIDSMTMLKGQNDQSLEQTNQSGFQQRKQSNGNNIQSRAFQMPIEELRMYQDIIQRYNMDDSVNSMLKQQFDQFNERQNAIGEGIRQDPNDMNTLNTINQIADHRRPKKAKKQGARNEKSLQGYNIENHNLINAGPGGQDGARGLANTINESNDVVPHDARNNYQTTNSDAQFLSMIFNDNELDDSLNQMAFSGPQGNRYMKLPQGVHPGLTGLSGALTTRNAAGEKVALPTKYDTVYGDQNKYDQFQGAYSDRASQKIKSARSSAAGLANRINKKKLNADQNALSVDTSYGNISSKSMPRKFKSKFGKEEPEIMQQQDLQAPPKTLGVNSIVVEIGDFKGQSDADKQQMKEREMKRQKQKKHLDQELKQQREAKILQKYTAGEARDDVLGKEQPRKVVKLNTLNNPDHNRKSVSSQKEPHVVSIDLKNKNFFLRPDEPDEKKASQVLNKSRTQAGLLKPNKTQSIPQSSKTPYKKSVDTDLVAMPSYNDPLQKMFEQSQDRGKRDKKLFNDYLEAQQENEDTLTGEDDRRMGPYEQIQIEDGLYKSDEEKKPNLNQEEEDLERQRQFQSQIDSTYKRKSSLIELNKDIQSRINVAKQSDQILQDRLNQPKKPAKMTNFIKQNRKEVLKKKSVTTPTMDQKYLSQQQETVQDFKNGSARKNRQQRMQKQPDKAADDIMLMKLLKE